MKRLLVTGGAGFIGSEFVRQAVAKGYRVNVLDSLSYAGDRARLKDVAKKIRFHKGDICDARKVLRVCKDAKPDVIVHFAAETHVDRSILDGQVFLKTNVLGTQTMLEAARTLGGIRFIHISTDEVYGDVLKGCSVETSPFRPNSPYSVSKAGADMLVSAYARTYGLSVNIIRASNNYGPWQYPEKLLPVVIYKAMHHQKIPVYGKGLNVREWLFVSDCARGVMAVLRQGRDGEAYNISSGECQRNIDVVRRVLEIMGRPETLIQFVEDRPGHDFRYSLSAAKAKRVLGWSPQYRFGQGILETVTWYKTHASWLTRKACSLKDYWLKIYAGQNS